MKTVMNHQFSDTPRVGIQRSSFNRSHGFKTTFDAAYLVPILVDEALPGDTFSVNMAGFARLATPIYPIMDNMRLETFFFAVPCRLLWTHWKNFMGEKASPTDSTVYVCPTITDLNNASNETIYDYMGIPTKVAANIPVNSLPFRAYNLIWNEWFRDQNLQTYAKENTDDGPDAMADYTLLKRGKRHDYFTSALPWTQKGDDVLLSLGDYAPVKGIGKNNQTWAFPAQNVYETGTPGLEVYPQSAKISTDANGYFYVRANVAQTHPDIRADLSEAIGPSVNELRQAIQVQRILEKDARSGTRYTEIIKAHFGVNSPDSRMQRPEYLGGGSTPVNITPVAHTATNVGKLAAMGTVAFSGHGFVKSFTEHCIIIGLANVRADITYQQGLDRMYSRSTRYDYYWPTLANLGEQAILNKEIYVDAAGIGDGSSEDVFGYQERYAEYRYKPSRITGKLRSNDAATLDAWHLGTEFDAQPALDATFIVDAPPIDRCIAVPTEPHFIFDAYFQMQCARPMPLYSIPGMIDHF